jgi:hypothetical protein
MCYSLLQQKQKTRSLRRGKLEEIGPAAKNNSPLKATSAFICCQVSFWTFFVADPHLFCLTMSQVKEVLSLPADQ